MNDVQELEILCLKVKEACLSAAQQAEQEAALSGLCPEGRLDYAIDAINTVDLKSIVRDFLASLPLEDV